MSLNEIQSDLELKQVLWACYEYWQGESCSPDERVICHSWVTGPYEDRFGTKFHQSRLGRLATLGFLEPEDTAKGGHRRYYKIADPDRVKYLLKEWDMI